MTDQTTWAHHQLSFQSNSNVIKSKGLLWYLVNNLCSRYVTNEVGVQTEHDSAHNIVATLGKLSRWVSSWFLTMTSRLTSLFRL